MTNLLYTFIGQLVTSAVLGLSHNQDNMCYQCAWLDSDCNSQSVPEQLNGVSTDISCKWGSGKPQDKFLVNCTVDEEEGFQYFYRCLYIDIRGALVDEIITNLNGSFYGCGVRRVQITPVVSKPVNTEIKASKLCQQDRLDQLLRVYGDETGKEFLQNLTSIFKPSLTRAHLCSCDFACYEPENYDNGMITEQNNGCDITTSNPGDDNKSTDASGENAKGSCAVVKVSGILLISYLLSLSYIY